jgi:hypothetical protein
MKTENNLGSVTVERVGTLTTLRTIDFQKLADESPDGKIDASLLVNGGDFSVRLTPTAKDSDPVDFPCDSKAGADAFVAGFVACANSRKRATGSKASDFDAETFAKSMTKASIAELKKPATIALAKHLGVDYKSNEKKGDIAARIIAAKKVK